jgi:hypothetical protein
MDRIDLARDRELLKCEMVGIRNSLAPWFGKITLRSVLPAEISSHVLLSADQNILFTFYRNELQNDLYTSSAFGRRNLPAVAEERVACTRTAGLSGLTHDKSSTPPIPPYVLNMPVSQLRLVLYQPKTNDPTNFYPPPIVEHRNL